MSDEHLDPSPVPPPFGATPAPQPPIAGATPPPGTYSPNPNDYSPQPPRYEAPGVPPVTRESDYLPPRRGGSGAGMAIVVSTVIAFVIALFAGFAGGYIAARTAGTVGTTSATPSKVTVVPSRTQEPVVGAAAAALPSVVYVEVTGKSPGGGGGSLPRTHPNVPESSTGSGVALKGDGQGGTYIVTNAHVVADASRIIVKDASGESVTAKRTGTDPDTDIAVLRVPKKIPAIAVGKSTGLQVGQMVVAIGAPYGLEHSVTSGVISAIGRSLPDFQNSDNSYPLVDVIQTDAAINPGNSGGALVDRTGKLIGINTAIYSNSGASDGIGFAVPVATAVRVADQLISGGSVKHPFLGIIGQTVTPALAKSKSLTVEQGALIVSVVKGTGASKAGLKNGDVITKLDTASIRSMDDLLLQVRRHKVGDSVQLIVVRQGKEQTITMVIGDKPDNVKVPGRETTPPTN